LPEGRGPNAAIVLGPTKVLAAAEPGWVGLWNGSAWSELLPEGSHGGMSLKAMGGTADAVWGVGYDGIIVGWTGAH
jgi:hypothetical protein